MKINMIAAVGENLELGKDNELIWNIPEDLKYFRDVTLGKTVVMGKNTFYSIGKVLPNRNNVIISRSLTNIEDAVILDNFEDVFVLPYDEVFIIGGETLYEYFLPYASSLFLTEVFSSCLDADKYFPSFDKSLYVKKRIRSSGVDNLKYDFVNYERKE